MASQKNIIKVLTLAGFLFLSDSLMAQSSFGENQILFAVIGLAILILLALVFVGDSLVKLEAQNTGVDTDGEEYSVLPSLSGLLGSKVPSFVKGGKFHSLKKGHDIKLEGSAEKVLDHSVSANTYAVKPIDFFGIAPIPKLMVAIGDTVKAGDPIFFDKRNPDIMFAAPVSGEIIAVNRGAKRAIEEVVILADKDQQYKDLGRRSLDAMSRGELVDFLCESGVWPMLRRRPFNTLVAKDETPDNIFVSTFDTAPLAPCSEMLLAGRDEAFQKGLDVLNKLTEGKVYLGLNGNSEPAAAFQNAQGVEKHYFKGAHPAGNVGIQMHHIAPVSLNTSAWTLGVQEVISFGTLFTAFRYSAERVVALTGAELANPRYVKTHLGASIENFVKDLADDAEVENTRFISGDVLSGKQIASNGFIGFFDDQITAIAENAEYELFGWALPLNPRPSISRTFPGFLMPNHEYRAETNTHGERRAFVVTGQYESVLPMDIYPQHLMKSIMIDDFEKMEGLGLPELVEEDIALCEFTCTSKQPLQQLVRQGLDMMREQG